jgi:hypothetical protein
MGSQAVSEFSICRIKKILSDVTQEVKVPKIAIGFA